ncbi:MAG: hypothetical protein OEV35_03970 [Gallionellaceae bacterium]|nr:hypothetical protein [Gallionellaceae bacterium]
MRVKSKWFKSGREKTPQEIADALAFIIWRIGINALKNTRKADFDVLAGPQYFAFLSEFLVFLVQVADRIAYNRLGAEEREVFTTALAVRLAGIASDNQAELLGGEAGPHRSNFIALLNRRAGEYAEFHYDSSGPNFTFVRYLGYCMLDVVIEKDKSWVVDQMTSIEAPEAMETVEKSMRSLLEATPAKSSIES